MIAGRTTLGGLPCRGRAGPERNRLEQVAPAGSCSHLVEVVPLLEKGDRGTVKRGQHHGANGHTRSRKQILPSKSVVVERTECEDEHGECMYFY